MWKVYGRFNKHGFKVNQIWRQGLYVNVDKWTKNLTQIAPVSKAGVTYKYRFLVQKKNVCFFLLLCFCVTSVTCKYSEFLRGNSILRMLNFNFNPFLLGNPTKGNW